MSTETTTPTAPAVPLASPSKVFIGNLAFELTEEDLTNEFSAYGKVVLARIITKRNNSLGYGFVEMEDEESAKKAIEGLNKKEIKGRAINVELTKERQPRPPRQPRQPSTTNTSSPSTSRPKKTNKRNGAAAGEKKESNGTAEEKTTEAATGEKPTNTRRRNTRRPSKKSDETATDKDATATKTDAATETPAAATGEKKESKPRRSTKAPRKPRAEKKPAAEKDTTPREESKDTVFVYNLPFSYNDEQLLALFKDYSPKSAHVIINPRFKKSKGFGFVVFENSEQQQKALAVDKTKVEERELNVRIALVDNKVPAAAATTAETPAAAATETPAAAN